MKIKNYFKTIVMCLALTLCFGALAISSQNTEVAHAQGLGPATSSILFSGAESGTNYNISKDESSATFKVLVNDTAQSTAQEGQEVKLTEIKGKKQGFTNEVDKAYYVDSSEVRTDIDTTSLTFVMPADNITIHVTTKEKLVTVNVPKDAIIKVVGENIPGNPKPKMYDEKDYIVLGEGEHKLGVLKIIKFFDTAEENTTVNYTIVELGNHKPATGTEELGFWLYYSSWGVENYTITAEIETIKYKLFIQQDEGVTVTATNGKDSYSNDNYVPKNIDLTLNLEIETGYQINEILLNGAPLAKTGENYVFNMGEQDNTIAVSTKKLEFKITIPTEVTVKRGEEILTNDSTIYYGDELEITYESPEQNSTTVAVNGATVLSGAKVTVTEDVSITYNSIQVKFQVLFEDTEDYTISVLNGETPVVSGAYLPENTPLTIQVTPTTGRNLLNIQINNVETDLSTPYSMPLENITITAQTEMINYTISKADTQNGTFEVYATAHYMDEVTVNATANTGYELARMYYKVAGSEAENIITNNKFSMPANNVTVYVKFVKIDYTLSKTEENCSITLGKMTANFGDEITVAVAPSAGYKVTKTYYILAGTTEQVEIIDGKFTMPAGNVTVATETAKVDYTLSKTEENCSITLGKMTANFGDEITVAVAPSAGYKVTKTYYILAGTTEQVEIIDGKFTMPAGNVTVATETAMIDYTITTNVTAGGTANATNTAHYMDEVTVSVTANTGYQLARMYYKVADSEVENIITNNKFSMPANNVTVYVEFVKIDYTLTIDSNVKVVRNGVQLTNADKVQIGDVLTLTYSTPGHYRTLVKANATPRASGETYIVSAEDVVISYSKTQFEWQVIFADGEHYTISVKTNGTPIESGTWLEKDVELELVISLAEGYDLTEVKVNGIVVEPIDNKILTIAHNITISATAEKKEVTISDENQDTIVIGERESLSNSELEIVIIEETTEDYAKVKSQIKNVKDLKAFNVKLVNKTTKEETILAKNIKVMLALPENFNPDMSKLYRVRDALINQEYTLETVNGKTYAVFETNTLGSFAFAETKEPVYEDNWLWILIVVAISLSLIGTIVTIFIKRAKRKKIAKWKTYKNG